MDTDVNVHHTDLKICSSVSSYIKFTLAHILHHQKLSIS